MEPKKSKSADIRQYRTIFFLVGMCFSLSVVYGVINYKQYEKDDSALDEYVYSEEEVEIEQTVQENEPPPPPEAPPVIEIVEDDEIIEEEQPEVEEIDIDDDTKIDAFIPIPDEDPGLEEPLEFYQVQEKARFKDGDAAMYKFINSKIVVPELALQEGQSGTVLVSFVVEKDGRITNVQIDPRSRRLGFGCEEAAMAVVRQMDGMWKAALQRDKPVRMRFSLPIKFVLN